MRAWQRGAAWLLLLVLGLTLGGCRKEETSVDSISVPVPGLYLCYSLKIQDLALDTNRRWLRLLPDGPGVFCLAESREDGTWTLEGDAFLWTPSGDGTEAEGTWEQGVLTLTIGEMSGVFVREGVEYPPKEPAPLETGLVPEEEEPTAEEPESTETDPLPDGSAQTQGKGQESPSSPTPAPARPRPAESGSGKESGVIGDGTADPQEEGPFEANTYACYGGLYYVDYDPQVFTTGPTGGADLVGADGTRLWFSRIASPDLVSVWVSGMAEKGEYQQYLSYEGHSETADGYPVQVIVYQDEIAWHAEALMDLGEDRGTGTLPMYAVFITCEGPSRQAVWTDGVKALLPTLRLGDPEL